MDNVEYLEVAGRSSAFKLAGASHTSLQLAAAADALAAARESRAVQMAPD